MAKPTKMAVQRQKEDENKPSPDEGGGRVDRSDEDTCGWSGWIESGIRPWYWQHTVRTETPRPNKSPGMLVCQLDARCIEKAGHVDPMNRLSAPREEERRRLIEEKQDT